MAKIFDISKLKLLAFMVIGYGSFYFLNNYLTKSLYLATAAHIVHLPTGVKMLMVLVSGVLGSLAIAIVGFAYGVMHITNGNYILALYLAFASAAAPLISVMLLKNIFDLTDDLSSLNFEKLLFLSLMFASLNSTIHQLIIYVYGEQIDFLNGLLIMFIGDVTGIFIVLYLFRFGLKVVKANKDVVN